MRMSFHTHTKRIFEISKKFPYLCIMILLLGDIHGNFNYLMKHIEKTKIDNCIIIQVGDFGIGFTNEDNDTRFLLGFNDFLSKKNITLYAIRGNHDNPDFFKGQHKYSNLQLLPDYTVLNLENKNFLFVGGAVSIDRKPRILENMKYARYGSRRRTYWYDEKVTYDENLIKEFRDIDILVTHTAPDFCLPTNKLGFGNLVETFCADDENLKEELIEERTVMTKMWNILNENNKIQKHFYGHFHRSNIEQIVDCEHRLLNINELYELR